MLYLQVNINTCFNKSGIPVVKFKDDVAKPIWFGARDSGIRLVEFYDFLTSICYLLNTGDCIFLRINGIMNKNFKPNERELIKVVIFFKKQSKKLIAEGKLGAEHKNVEDAVDRFVDHMNNHANTRAFILEQRESLKKLVKDNPQCPQCHTNNMLKLVGSEKNEKGWKSNRYKCRKCNITFTWNMPNNPWDMILYIEEILLTMRTKLGDVTIPAEEKEHASGAINSMQDNLDKLKPVIDAHDQEFNLLQTSESEMEKLIHEFKNSLLIEKIKMDTWENSR